MRWCESTHGQKHSRRKRRGGEGRVGEGGGVGEGQAERTFTKQRRQQTVLPEWCGCVGLQIVRKVGKFHTYRPTLIILSLHLQSDGSPPTNWTAGRRVSSSQSSVQHKMFSCAQESPCALHCTPYRLSESHSCLNLYPCVIKFSQSISQSVIQFVSRSEISPDVYLWSRSSVYLADFPWRF